MQKVKRLFELVKDVDAVLVTSQNNRQYFTGFSGTFGFMVLTVDKAVYITDSRYTEMAKEVMDPQGIEVVQIGNGITVYEKTIEILKETNAKKVGFEHTEMTVAEFEALKTKLNEFEFIPVGDKILKVREVKDEQELEFIKIAQSYTDNAFTNILKHINDNTTEIDISVELEYQMRKQGAQNLAFETIVASGANSSKPHAHPTNKKIECGDPITMDFGARYNGYCADMTRTVFFGKPSKEMENIYNIVLKAQKAAIEALKAGVCCKDMDAVARDIIGANGYREYFQHSLGHCVGLDIHERPSMSPLCADLLVENNVMTVEPGIYVPGLGGVRIEDLCIIKNDGIINLTKSNKDIIIL